MRWRLLISSRLILNFKQNSIRRKERRYKKGQAQYPNELKWATKKLKSNNGFFNHSRYIKEPYSYAAKRLRLAAIVWNHFPLFSQQERPWFAKEANKPLSVNIKKSTSFQLTTEEAIVTYVSGGWIGWLPGCGTSTATRLMHWISSRVNVKICPNVTCTRTTPSLETHVLVLRNTWRWTFIIWILRRGCTWVEPECRFVAAKHGFNRNTSFTF